MRATTNAALRAKTKRKLLRRKKKEQLKEFLVEVRARAGEGYSTRQLMRSLTVRLPLLRWEVGGNEGAGVFEECFQHEDFW